MCQKTASTGRIKHTLSQPCTQHVCLALILLIKQLCQGVSHTFHARSCPKAGVSAMNVPQECTGRVSSVKQECPTCVSSNSVPQCLASIVSYKSVSESVLHEYECRIQ